MLPEVADAVIILVLFRQIAPLFLAEAVFGENDFLTGVGLHHIHRKVVKAIGIDKETVVVLLQIGVGAGFITTGIFRTVPGKSGTIVVNGNVIVFDEVIVQILLVTLRELIHQVVVILEDLRIMTLEHRIQPPAGIECLLMLGGQSILGVGGNGISRLYVNNSANFTLAAQVLKGFDCLIVGKDHIVAGHNRLAHIRMERRVGTESISGHAVDAGLVDGAPVIALVAQSRKHSLGVMLKPANELRVQDAAHFNDPVGQITMEQIEEGHNTGFLELIHHITIVVKACLANLPRALGEDPGPGDGEPKCLQAQLFHHLDVLGIAVIEISGLIGVCTLIFFGVEIIVMLAYILALAALMAAGLDLASGASRAKEKVLGKSKFHKNILLFSAFIVTQPPRKASKKP